MTAAVIQVWCTHGPKHLSLILAVPTRTANLHVSRFNKKKSAKFKCYTVVPLCVHTHMPTHTHTHINPHTHTHTHIHTDNPNPSQPVVTIKLSERQETEEVAAQGGGVAKRNIMYETVFEMNYTNGQWRKLQIKRAYPAFQP